ncbi:type II secretion system protein [Plectonema cf. radiosum LEGE 06105]|uniref:Type II secretion system protein n=1 Tax=Plectonema cf. radiosum LEGE 06105 TaxID=945769 RepID=A0A8J7F4R6_9CYAN|nr:hormogonium polysaccharide secretion pseudopilin HpsC [Plectonema radiosum]MBE9216426.1 type II secretion system protein [Plectonema cf. radiosum LEGE 06105]
MRNQLNFLRKNNLKQKHFSFKSKNSGFTLIELLVAMILAVLVITPLLGFMINILDTDRKEQAKVNSEQEIQTALDYIAQDLQQAIYIYDAKGVKAIKNKLPYSTNTDRVPVLVFWKRQFEKEAIAGSFTGKNDSFVYSLVAYYLIQSNTNNNGDKIWSNQFRIARFELKGGVRNLDDPFKKNGDPNYIKEPDKGFALFELSNPAITGTLEDKMNSWKKDETISTNTYNLSNTAILVDYIDGSQDSSLRGADKCETFFDLSKYISTKQDDKKKALKVPSFEDTYKYSNITTLNNSSFYACVDVDTVSAKIFLRGNAYARINQKDNNFNKSRESYFPTASVLVKGRGLIGAN